jgi:hypothetical protein
MALAEHAVHLHLHALHGAVHKAPGALGGDLLAQHVPELDGTAQLHAHAVGGEQVAVVREAELEAGGAAGR